MKHILQIAAIALMAASLISCHKEEENNNNSTPQDTTQTTVQNHNVELVYGNTLDAWQHIELDTIQKYNSDLTVDTIFMIPEYYTQFSSQPTNPLKNIVSKLRERKNINPNKVWGKGELMLNADAVRDNPEIIRFFADTLKYNVTYYGK